MKPEGTKGDGAKRQDKDRGKPEKKAQIRDVSKILAEEFLQSEEGIKLLQEMSKVFDLELG